MERPDLTMTTAIDSASLAQANVSDTTEQTSPAERVSPPCHLLALAAELRNYIWTLSFSPDNSESIDLEEAKMPGASLLSTCKQIHSEAIGLFAVAKVDYWRSSQFPLHFEVQNDESPVPLEDKSIDHVFQKIPADELAMVTHLTLEDDNVSLTYEKGFWTCTCTSDPSPSWYEPRYVPHLAMRVMPINGTEEPSFDAYRHNDDHLGLQPSDIEDWTSDRMGNRFFIELAEGLSEEELSSAKRHTGWFELSKGEICDILFYVRNIATP
jgi:hypothetical protein